MRCVICGTPRNWRKAVHALRESKGEIVAVSDDEIMDAMNQTARLSAVFGERSGAASVAGVKCAIADGVIKKSDSVSAVITGNGLKDTKAAIETAGTPMNTFALTNSGLTGPIHFLIYGYKVGAAAGTWRIDNLSIQGGVSGEGSLGTDWYVDSISVNDTTCCMSP